MAKNQDMLDDCCDRLTAVQHLIQVDLSEEAKSGLMSMLEDIKKLLAND
jgi:hypothetical protein